MPIETQTVAYVDSDVFKAMSGMIYGAGRWNVEVEDSKTILVWMEIANEPEEMGVKMIPPLTKKLELRVRMR